MKKALVCEKWELPIYDGRSGFFSHTNIGELSRRAICFEWLMESVAGGIYLPQKEESVAEFFGGIGLQTVIIQNILKPDMHWVSDYDKDCYEQLVMNFSGKPGVYVHKADAKDVMKSIDANIIILDFPNMTAKHYKDWEEPLGVLFSKRPSIVEITDVGNRYLHLHRNLYSDILDYRVDTIEDYILGISRYLLKRFGYQVFQAAYKSGTSYMLASAKPVEDINFLRVGPNPHGFRYLDDN